MPEDSQISIVPTYPGSIPESTTMPEDSQTSIVPTNPGSIPGTTTIPEDSQISMFPITPSSSPGSTTMPDDLETYAKVAWTLRDYVRKPSILLALNAGLAKHHAIYRVRTADDFHPDCESDSSSGTTSDVGSVDDFCSCRDPISSGYRKGSLLAAAAKRGRFFDLFPVDRTVPHCWIAPSFIPEHLTLADYLVSFIKDLEVLKIINDVLVKIPCRFRMTLLPNEPRIEEFTVEELTNMVACNFSDHQFAFEGYNRLVNRHFRPPSPSMLHEDLRPHQYFLTPEGFPDSKFGCDLRCDYEDRLRDARNERQCTASTNPSKLIMHNLRKKITQKLAKGNGVVGKWMKSEEARKEAKFEEKQAWEMGVAAWKLSFLDKGWWDEMDERGWYRPVWSHERYDLAPEQMKETGSKVARLGTAGFGYDPDWLTGY